MTGALFCPLRKQKRIPATSLTFSFYFPSKSAVKKERYLTLYKVPGCFECVFSNPTISLKCFRLVYYTYRKCFKILNTTELPSNMAQKNRADPDQTASEEAVWSRSALFAFLTILLWISSLITNIIFENRKRKVFKILEYLRHLQYSIVLISAPRPIDTHWIFYYEFLCMYYMNFWF